MNVSKGAVLIAISCNIIIAASWPFVCASPILPHSPTQIFPAAWTENAFDLSSGRQLSSSGGGNDDVTAILEHFHASWSADESVVILLTAAEVDSKYLPVTLFDGLNQQIKYYYVLLQRKGYSLYKVIRKTLLQGKPMQTGYHVMLKPVGNFSINFGLTFNFGASGNIS